MSINSVNWGHHSQLFDSLSVPHRSSHRIACAIIGSSRDWSLVWSPRISSIVCNYSLSIQLSDHLVSQPVGRSLVSPYLSLRMRVMGLCATTRWTLLSLPVLQLSLCQQPESDWWVRLVDWWLGNGQIVQVLGISHNYVVPYGSNFLERWIKSSYYYARLGWLRNEGYSRKREWERHTDR